MKFKDKPHREVFNLIEHDFSKDRASLLNTIEVLCKSSPSPDVYRRYMELIEKLRISLEANTTKSSYEYLNQFINGKQIKDVKDKDIVGLLLTLLLNVQFSVLIGYLSDAEYYSYGFPGFETKIENFLSNDFIGAFNTKMEGVEFIFEKINNEIDKVVKNSENTPIFDSMQSIANLIKENLKNALDVYLEFEKLDKYLNNNAD